MLEISGTLSKLQNTERIWKILDVGKLVGIMHDLDKEKKVKSYTYEELKEKKSRGENGWYIYEGKMYRETRFHQ